MLETEVGRLLRDTGSLLSAAKELWFGEQQELLKGEGSLDQQ
jgi:hypothetical protein